MQPDEGIREERKTGSIIVRADCPRTVHGLDVARIALVQKTAYFARCLYRTAQQR
jgi:hypothetical protein